MSPPQQTTPVDPPASGDDAPEPHESYARGITFILIASLCFTLMAAAAKAAAAEGMESPLVVLARSAFTGGAVAILMLAKGLPFRSNAPRALHGRWLFGTIALQLYFFALSRAPLGDTVVLANTSPLFVPFLAILFLGERPKPLLFGTILVGFAGVVTLVGPIEAEWNKGLLAGVAIGVAGAGAGVCLRLAAGRDHWTTIVFVFSMWSFVTSLPALYWFDANAVSAATPALLLVGLFALGAQFFLTLGYASTPASILSPMGYASVFVSYFIGAFYFNETPTTHGLIGAAMIGTSCVFTSWKSSTLVTVRKAESRRRPA